MNDALPSAKQMLEAYRDHLDGSPMLEKQLRTLKDLTKDEAVELLYLMITHWRDATLQQLNKSVN